jgi:two-component system, cell cycle sensor histidine kinase and response regulator CckA
VILGSLELALAELDDNHPVRGDLKQAQLAALRSSDLTRRLLTFARRQVLQPRVLDVNEVIGESVRLMRPLLSEEIAFEWLPGASLWRVMADDSQLQQAVANLCVNARDAIEGIGRIVIRTDNVVLDEAAVAARAGARAGSWVRVTVSDTGRGMSADVLEKAFEPFFTTKAIG